VSYSEVVAAYEEEYPTFVALATAVEDILDTQLREAGLHALPVTARAKDPVSFGIKACVGRKYDNPLAQIEDKAGARITVIYERDVDAVVSLVQQTFTTSPPERKLDALDFDQNGYLGTHLNATLTQEQVAASDPAFAERVFEIQVRTVAQTAWAEVSHAQLYKPSAEVPKELKRRIYRLVALVELFDSEVEQFLVEASTTDGYKEAAALAGLIPILTRLGNTRRADRQLTAELGAAVVPLYEQETEAVKRILHDFAAAREAPLRTIIAESESLEAQHVNPLLGQPELPMLCERLENDRINLEHAWPVGVPYEWLDDLAEKWGLGRSPS
jgi:ppGpp synthetase/RelA/SpoT-type nucleotidyltranferase